MPCPEPQSGLQRVVVGGANAVELVHAPIVGELRGVLTELIDVQHDGELAAFTADIPNLPDCHPVTEALLDVQVVVKEVGGTEILVDGEHVEGKRQPGGGVHAVPWVGSGKKSAPGHWCYRWRPPKDQQDCLLNHRQRLADGNPGTGSY